MPKVTLARRFADGRMKKELRACGSEVARRRLECIRLTKLDYARFMIAEVVGLSDTTVRDTVRRFNERGFPGIVDDGRSQNGRAPAIAFEQEAALLDALKGPAPDGGLWNGRKVRDWLASMFGILGGKRFGWGTLRRLDFSLQRPQRHHIKGDLHRQEELKKNFRVSWPPSAPSSPTSPSSSGRKTRRASASNRSSGASGHGEANALWPCNTSATSGYTSTAS